MKLLRIIAAALIIVSAAGCTPTPQAQPEPSIAAPTAAKTPEPSPTNAPPEPSPTFEAVCYVSADSVRLRAKAGTDADILCSLPYGLELQKLTDGQEWTKVKYDEWTGYMDSSLVSDTAPEPRDLSVQTPENPSIVVKKAKRVLELWDGSALVAIFPVGLGFTPVGPKQEEGDGRTPEGDYYVCVRNSHSRFYLSLGVSYPNKDDAKAALDDGRIDQRTFDKIARAIDGKQKPSWSTPLGGEIMIHGHGSNSDWTAGCVAVDNETMDILWAACPMGTPISILP